MLAQCVLIISCHHHGNSELAQDVCVSMQMTSCNSAPCQSPTEAHCRHAKCRLSTLDSGSFLRCQFRTTNTLFRILLQTVWSIAISLSLLFSCKIPKKLFISSVSFFHFLSFSPPRLSSYSFQYLCDCSSHSLHCSSQKMHATNSCVLNWQSGGVAMKRKSKEQLDIIQAGRRVQHQHQGWYSFFTMSM